MFILSLGKFSYRTKLVEETFEFGRFAFLLFWFCQIGVLVRAVSLETEILGLLFISSVVTVLLQWMGVLVKLWHACIRVLRQTMIYYPVCVLSRIACFALFISLDYRTIGLLSFFVIL